MSIAAPLAITAAVVVVSGLAMAEALAVVKPRKPAAPPGPSWWDIHRDEATRRYVAMLAEYSGPSPDRMQYVSGMVSAIVGCAPDGRRLIEAGYDHSARRWYTCVYRYEEAA